MSASRARKKSDLLQRLNDQVLTLAPKYAGELFDAQEYELRELYNKVDLRRALYGMTNKINQHKAFGHGSNPLLLTVLDGAAPSSAYLVPQLHAYPLETNTIKTSRYGASTVGGDISIQETQPASNYSNRPIIIYDDIIDRAVTACKVIEFLIANGANPELIFLAVMFNKEVARDAGYELDADFYALSVANNFLVGYGLDYGKVAGRDLPDVYALVKHDAELAKPKPVANVFQTSSAGSRYLLLAAKRATPQVAETKEEVLSPIIKPTF